MKIVINTCFGGFWLPDKALETLGPDTDTYTLDRSDPRLVSCVDDVCLHCRNDVCSLEIAEIPDNATDWYIFEYDGLETLVYVVDGKIHEYKEVNV